MTDQFYHPLSTKNSSQRAFLLQDKLQSPYSTGFMSPQNLRSTNSTQSKNNYSNFLTEKQKQYFPSLKQKEQIPQNGIFKINKSYSSKSLNNPYALNNNVSHKFDKTIFDIAEHQIDEKMKTQSSKSLSIQKYKELISNTSPTTIHLPAQRIGPLKITEFADKDLNSTIKEGFTSFYQIKSQNQDYLINLNQTRKSINQIIDLGDLEVQRQYTKKKEQKKEPQKIKPKQDPNDYILQYQYENKDHIQLELDHNKAMLNSFNSNHEQMLVRMYRDAFVDQVDTEKKILKMPPIRKYPNQRRKQTQHTIPKEEEEMDQKLLDQKKLQEEIKTKIQRYMVYFYTIPQNDWKPNAREGASLVIDKNKAYLFGGMGQDIFNSIEVLDLEQNLKWNNFEHQSVKNNIPTPRFGHTMNFHKGSLIVFGGETHFNTNFKQRQCLFDIYQLNLEQKKWTFANVSGDIPCGRRCHTSSIVGRWLIVHGGSNFRDTTLSDLWAFDLGTSSWQEISTVCQDMSKNKYSSTGHSSCSVFYSARQNKLMLFKYIDVKVPKWIPQITHEGVYYFGGKDEEGKVSNTLRILKTDQNPLGWLFPQILGSPPQPRFGHIICGGKNEDEYLNDIHVLNLETLNWLQVETVGAKQLPRASHSAVSYDSKLVIFGGLNDKGYLSSQIQMIELDENLSKQMITKDQQKQKIMYEQNLRIEKQKLQKEQKEKAKLLNHDRRKSIDHGGLYYYADHNNNYDYGDIPFSSKLIKEEEDNSNVKTQIEKLNFNNFISFLPLPSKANKIGSRLQHQRTLSQYVVKKTPKSSLNQSSFSNSSQKEKSEKVEKSTLKEMLSPSKLLLQKTVNKIINNLKHE